MNIEQLKEWIKKNYDPDVNGQDYWETGNFDETFAIGVDVGYNDGLKAIAKLLDLDLPPRKEMEY